MPELLQVIAGIGLVLVLHITAIFLGSVIAGLLINVTLISDAVGLIAVYGLFGIGLSQMIYITPVLIYLRKRQAWGLFKGVIIGAILTILLNGGCWLLIYSAGI